jgi:hypothetical protein
MDRVVATRRTPVPRLSVHRWSARAGRVATGELQRTGMLPGLTGGVAGAGLIAVGGVLVGPQARPYGPGATIAGYVASYLGLLLLVGAWLHIGHVLRRQPGPAFRGRGGGRHAAALRHSPRGLVCQFGTSHPWCKSRSREDDRDPRTPRRRTPPTAPSRGSSI